MSKQRPYGRPEPSRLPARRILIVCEGETEENYFSDFRKERGLSALIVERAGVPLTVVERAIELKGQETRDPFLAIWCVFDRDEHPNIRKALKLASDNDFKVAFSLPSFELWYILHKRDQAAHIERGKAEKLCQKCFTGWRKPESLYSACRGLESDAARRAKGLRAKHTRDGNHEHTNPSTGCDLLVASLRQEVQRHEQNLARARNRNPR